MFVLHPVVLALLAASTAQSGIPRYIQGQWVITDESLQYDDADVQSLAAEERVWPERPPEVAEHAAVEDQSLLTTPEPYAMKEQASDEGGADSAVWKIVLVAAVLLVSVVGSLSTAYYLCVWRGGRIHYQPQKEGYA